MNLFFSKDASVLFKTKVILLDSDVLGFLFYNPHLIPPIGQFTARADLLLHPFVETEFLRDIFLPQQRLLAEQFIARPIFGHLSESIHLELLPKITQDALLLSRIYAHQADKRKKKETSSFVDLHIGAFLMHGKEDLVLFTRNKKDFPSCVFNTLAVLNYESDDGDMSAYYIVGFNQEKFEFCLDELKKVKNIPSK